MTAPAEIRFEELGTDDLATLTGRIAVIASGEGKLDAAGRKVNRLTRKALERLIASERWTTMKPGDAAEVTWPAGMAAEAVILLKLDTGSAPEVARKAGAALAKLRQKGALTVLMARQKHAAEIALGLALRGYEFDSYRTSTAEDAPAVTVLRCPDPEALAKSSSDLAAVAEGVFFARDLVNEPANVLTTEDFAARLAAMGELGLEVEILDEAQLEELGMRLLLSVGQGSASPSKVVVMRWQGGAPGAAPLALVGKGVVFDTGGISLKPAAGMWDMTMDMGGAGTVAGVMRTLALRNARANVVGLVGLVENMPSGTATRPGDIVRSMKGDTVEIQNTDAEGRLVLADLLWYTQNRFSPCGVIDLATLTGAILVALGQEHAGVFSNDDKFVERFLKAASAEDEGAWRLPLGDAYDALLKSQKADMKNIGGKYAGSITAAQFLQRFVAKDMPWIHLDIAGTASTDSETALSPKGATGWGVRALNRLIRDTQG